MVYVCLLGVLMVDRECGYGTYEPVSRIKVNREKRLTLPMKAKEISEAPLLPLLELLEV